MPRKDNNYKVARVKLYPNKTQKQTINYLMNLNLTMTKDYYNYYYKRLDQGKPLVPTKAQPRAYQEWQEELKTLFWKLRGDHPEVAGRFIQPTRDEVTQAFKSYQGDWRAYKQGKLKHKPGLPKPPKEARRFLIRSDGVEIDKEKHLLILKASGETVLKLSYKGEIPWEGKIGEVEVRLEKDGNYYALIPIKNPKKPRKEEKPAVEPKRELVAGIDLGLNNLMAIVLYDKTTGELVGSMIVRGRPLKAVMFKYKRLISKVQKSLKANDLKTSRRLRKAYWRLVRTLESLSRMLVVKAFKLLKALGVKELVIGDLKNIPRDKGKKTNFLIQYWSYGKLKDFIKFKAEEFDFELKWVNEAKTSITDPWSGEVIRSPGEECSQATGKHFVFGRVFRGLFKSPSLGKVLNADLVGAFNILRKVYNITPSPAQLVKVLSGGSSIIVGFWKELGGVGVRGNGFPQTLKPLEATLGAGDGLTSPPGAVVRLS